MSDMVPNEAGDALAETAVIETPATTPIAETGEGGAYWPDDWREQTAATIAGDDPKARAKELKRLERYADPAGIYTKARELEAKLSESGSVKLPGPKASPQDIAAYHRAIGVPNKPSDYFDMIELDGGAVLGPADRPLAEGFAAALHPAGATPAVVAAALSWYFRNEEVQAAELDTADEDFKVASERVLKDEFGPAFARRTGAIAALFASAPGGTNLDDPDTLFARLMGGRLADGRIAGNDPDMVRFLVGLARELHPTATVTEAGNASGQSIDSEIAEIREKMREDRRGYFADDGLQARYRELIATRGENRRG